MAEDDTWQKAFGEKWDAIVLGTGLKECLLSGLLSVAGKKVLHLDRNSYYGGASASLDIHQLFTKFGVESPPSACLALIVRLALARSRRLSRHTGMLAFGAARAISTLLLSSLRPLPPLPPPPPLPSLPPPPPPPPLPQLPPPRSLVGRSRPRAAHRARRTHGALAAPAAVRSRGGARQAA